MIELKQRRPAKCYLAAIFILFLTLIPSMSSASTLQLDVFNPGKNAIFPVTSTLIYGEHEAALVDAQFQKRYVRQLVERIKASGRTLKFVFVSHSDPDYHFGLAEIRKAFPQVDIISTAQTAYLISASKDAKLDVWKEKLGQDAPDELIVPRAAQSNELTVDGEKISIQQDNQDSAHSFLWIPSQRTVLGGISVLTGSHLWMADTSTIGDIDRWVHVIDRMRALDPIKVIPGHFVQAETSPTQLDFVKQYLLAYRSAAASSREPAGLIAKMTDKFPALPDTDTLAFGARVFFGEQPWHVASPYPPIGRIAEVKFGTTQFNLDFKDNHTMSFEGTEGAFKGVKDVVEYSAVEVSPNVFMVYWHEPSTGSNVVHVQDWNTGTVYTNIAGRDSSFLHFSGSIKLR